MAPTTSEPFTLISTLESTSIAPDFTDVTSARVADVDIQLTKSLREHYPELCLTAVPAYNAPLIDFAAAGYAAAELDTNTESIFRWRGYYQSSHRGGSGQLGDAIFFAKYHYTWSGSDFIVYTVDIAGSIQYILKEPDAAKGEHALSNCSATDSLIKTCAEAFQGIETDFVYVYDGYWRRSRELWEEVQKAGWGDVILNPNMKKALTSVTKNFFDSKEVYRRYGVPWKRGLIFYGPPGNGKTISIKALMKELSMREKDPIPTLYVKAASYTFEIGEVFSFARSMTPCMLILEDIETIVTQETRSYFFNEVDGLANNDGILMVASTNYLDRLDSGLSKRPSRFDRKYNFPLPNSDEREEYAQYWREKLGKSSPSIEFPKKLCPAIAKITKKFSFAYMQEAFIAALLQLAREDQEEDFGEAIESDEAEGDDDDPLDKYKLWRAMKTNVRMLRKDMESHKDDGNGDDEDDIVGLSSKNTVTNSGQHSRRFGSFNRGLVNQRPPSSQIQGTIPERPFRLSGMAPPRSGHEIPHWHAFGARNANNGRYGMDDGRTSHGPRAIPDAGPVNARAAAGSYRDGTASGITKRKSSEPSQAEMASVGVSKGRMLAETAWETVLY